MNEDGEVSRAAFDNSFFVNWLFDSVASASASDSTRKQAALSYIFFLSWLQ